MKKIKFDTKDRLESVFEKYMNEWNRLDAEYNNVLKIPIYHFIKQMSILNKKHELTNNYSKYLKKTKQV